MEPSLNNIVSAGITILLEGDTGHLENVRHILD